ncbi:MAG: glycosyltransferase family 4 protein, partial [Candidatus Woesearchaeota archaeon]
FLVEVIPKLKDDFQITVIAPDFSGENKGNIPGVKIIRVPLMKKTFGDYTPARIDLSLIKQHVKDSDIVWSQTIGSIGAPAIYYGKKYKKHVVSYIHSLEWNLVTKAISPPRFFEEFFKIPIKRFAKILYNKCELLMIPHIEIASEFKQKGINTKTEVVKLGVNVEKFVPPQEKSIVKKALGLDPNKVTIGYVGRIGREKDVLTLYKGFKKLQQIHPNVQLLVVGIGVKEVENVLKKDPSVKLAGNQNNVVPYYQALDIYVLPSLLETTSLTTLEAMSCGVACLVTPVGYVKEYIKRGYNGLFFPRKNPYVLVKKLEILLDNNLRNRLGRNARKTVVEKFSWEQTTTKIKESLLKL